MTLTTIDLEPSLEARVIFRRYVQGQVSLQEMGLAVDQLLHRPYGPLGLSRNGMCSNGPRWSVFSEASWTDYNKIG
jgi:hypothetical protein